MLPKHSLLCTFKVHNKFHLFTFKTCSTLLSISLYLLLHHLSVLLHNLGREWQNGNLTAHDWNELSTANYSLEKFMDNCE